MNMHDIHSFEMNIIRDIQAIRHPWVDYVFFAINIFDNDLTYLIIIIFVWNFMNKKAGFHLLYLELIGMVTYTTLKLCCAQPRPYELMLPLKILGATGYGFPSGAATAASICFGFIFCSLKPNQHALRIGCLLIILLAGLARVYLGAHFPSDVLGGYLVATLLLGGYWYSINEVEKQILAFSKPYQLLFHGALTALLLTLNGSLSTLHALAFLWGAIIFHLFFDTTEPIAINMRSKLIISLWTTLTIGVFFTTIKMIAAYLTEPLSSALLMSGCFVSGLWLGYSSSFLIRFKNYLNFHH